MYLEYNFCRVRKSLSRGFMCYKILLGRQNPTARKHQSDRFRGKIIKQATTIRTVIPIDPDFSRQSEISPNVVDAMRKYPKSPIISGAARDRSRSSKSYRSFGRILHRSPHLFFVRFTLRSYHDRLEKRSGIQPRCGIDDELPRGAKLTRSIKPDTRN